MWRFWQILLSVVLITLIGRVSANYFASDDLVWTPQEWQKIESLSLANLPTKPSDPSNRFAQNPEAAQFGQALFFDKRLSREGSISCASCHQPDKAFTDGLALTHGLGVGKRNAPSLYGAAYQTWFFWDGRKDSLWSQALAPLEDEHEHGLTRTDLLKIVFSDPQYRNQYQHIFQLEPLDTNTLVSAKPSGTVAEIRAWNALSGQERQQIDRHFSNIGKALAAYVGTLPIQPTRLDKYISAKQTGSSQTILSQQELEGLRLFISPKAQCINCHSGALLTNQSFHNIGTSTPKQDSGRAAVLDELRLDRFNCLGTFSDAKSDTCHELKFLQRSRHQSYGAYKTPSLRNVSKTAPYFHDGRFNSLETVLDYYVTASHKTNAGIHLSPLSLSSDEKQQLLAFLKALDAIPSERL